MGFLDFIDGAAKVLDFLDKISGVSDSSSSATLSKNDPDELIEECEEYLLEFSTFSVDEVDEALNCLSRFERRWLKLDRIDSNCDDATLSGVISRLDSERDKALSKFEQELQDVLDELSEACKAENDPEKWQVLNDQWFKYMSESQKITNHKIKFLDKISSNALDFLNG